MSKLFILFAAMPIVEIALLIQVGEAIGGWNTVGFVLLTAFLGAFLVKREGLSTLQQAQVKLSENKVPSDELAQGLLLLVAGVLLVTPGFVTDIVGMLFTLPPTRKLLAKQIAQKFAVTRFVNPSAATPRHQQQAHSDIIEGEFHETGHTQLNEPDNQTSTQSD